MKSFRLVLFSALLASSALPLTASTLYWDADGNAAGDNSATGAGLGGSGNWDQESSLWFNGTSDIVWTNSNFDNAVFSGTAGTVVLTENISAGNVYFTNVTGNYVITNATGAEILTIAGSIDTGGDDQTIGAPITASSSLSKNGIGRLHLTGNNGSGITSLAINQGDVSVENNNAVGASSQISVASGAALVLNGGTNGLTAFYPSVTISGTGITNTGALRNLSGVTTFYGQIILGQNNSVIYVDSGAALLYDGENGPLTDNGNDYNLIVSASGTGNFYLGATSIGGTLIVQGPASCYSYLNGISPSAWTSTYVYSNGTFYVENFNSFGTQPATLMTTNTLLNGGTIVSSGTYTMYTNDGITVTTNGGTLNNNSGTWTTCNLYSQSNASITFGGAANIRPGGASGTTYGTINLGTGSIIKNGANDLNVGYANPALEIYSNLVLNGGSLSFNYDASGGTTSLGTVPATLNPSNIYFNGGSLHVGHSTTIGATRGIYVATNGGTIEDVVSSGGTVTINSPISGPGSMNFPNGYAGKVTAIILAANNTYAGTTTIAASSSVTVGAGGTAGSLGAGNTTLNGILTFNLTSSYSYGGVISGSGSLVKASSGTVTLTGANTYSGNTTNSAGTLFVNNTTGSGTGTGSVVVSAGTLGGSGIISGPVTLASGATLGLGLKTLTVNNSLSLAGNISVSVNKSLTPSNGMAVVSGALTGTGSGTVAVTNLGSSLVVGDTFQLFNQALSGGGSLTITGGGTGVVFTNNLAINGTISVISATVSTPSTPRINQVQNLSGNIVFSGTNGTANGTYTVLSTTNLALPLNQWTPVSTNTFSATGQFSVTNPISPTMPEQFYLLQVP